MSPAPVLLLIKKPYVIGGLIVLVLAVSTLATLRFLKKEEVKREQVRAERVDRAEQEIAEASRLAALEAERKRREREEAERKAREEAERAEAEEQARLARLEQERMEQERALQREKDRQEAEARRQRETEREEARRKRLAEEEAARRKAEAEAEARRKAEEERQAQLNAGLAAQQALAGENAERAAKDAAAQEAADELEAYEATQDETPVVETESTIDRAREVRGWRISGDLRPIIEYETEVSADGIRSTDGWTFGGRARLGVTWGALRQLHLGARLAGVCFTDDCDAEFVMEPATPASNGLSGGQVTLDQLYLHWFRTGKFDLAVGRLQTRFVLRGGVYAKSLDRNNSNNVNVNWTDGLHGTYRIKRKHEVHLVLERNVAEGTGSIRRGPLNFDDSRARLTYFAAMENINSLGPIVQRAVDVSYLPDSLLKDGTIDGRREDYAALVGRLMFRYPNRRNGLRLRAGPEIGFAPETQTCQSANLGCSGDVSGLAWNIVASAMEFAPHQSIGINYARTGPGWYLSPQYGPNEELFEIRHQWYPKKLPLLEARVRWRREIEQQVGATQKENDFDFYLRMTWEFTLKDF